MRTTFNTDTIRLLNRLSHTIKIMTSYGMKLNKAILYVANSYGLSKDETAELINIYTTNR